MEGDRALAQAHDHHVTAGLDALGDGDLAFAAEQLDSAHFAQIHAHGVIRAAFAGSFLGGGGGFDIGGLGAGLLAIDADLHFGDFGLFFSRSFCFLVVFDDLNTHFGQGRLDILDLIGAHFAGWQRSVELVPSDVALFLRLRDELLDTSFVEIDERSIAFRFVRF